MPKLSTFVTELFPGRRIAVVGDIVADQFLHGTISRVSREAPVFILRHDATDTVPGSAANAAANVASLGGVPILVGVTGNDANGDLLMDRLSALGVDTSGVVRSDAVTTTTKVRVLAGQHYAARQQVIRIDYEDQRPLADEARSALLGQAELACGSADAIVLSDYNYGVVSPALFETVKRISSERSIPLIVDSRHGLTKLAGATAATPNSEEVEQILGGDFTSEQCSELRERLGFEALLVTRGNKGMHLFEQGKELAEIDAVGAKEPVDVTGAGDTVIAAFALGLAAGLRFEDAARIANHAGGIVVMKKGTALVTPAELLTSIEEYADAELSSNA